MKPNRTSRGKRVSEAIVSIASAPRTIKVLREVATVGIPGKAVQPVFDVLMENKRLRGDLQEDVRSILEDMFVFLESDKEPADLKALTVKFGSRLGTIAAIFELRGMIAMILLPSKRS